MQISGIQNLPVGGTRSASVNEERRANQRTEEGRYRQTAPDRPSQAQPNAPTDDAATIPDQQKLPVELRQDGVTSRYQFYETHSLNKLPRVQQEALQTYSANQTLSREAEASGEYLSGVDLFA